MKPKWYWKATFVDSYGITFIEYSLRGFKGIETCARDLAQSVTAGFFDRLNNPATLIKAEFTLKKEV